MDLNIFFKTIKEAGKIRDKLYDMAIELHQYSGLYMSDSTIIESVKGRRTPKYERGSMNEIGFIQYFNERTTSTWSDMQMAFGKLDEYDFINRDTKDAEVFYRSLLALFYELIRLAPVSLRHILPEKLQLFGRKNELERIAEIFKVYNYAFLTGIGGIGKSHVALAYAHILNESGDWIIQHVVCEDTDTIRKLVIQLQFDGLTELKKSEKDTEENKFSRRVNALKNCLKPTLIILDNLNQSFSQEDHKDFKKLTECGHHVRLLITSRNTLVHDKQCVSHIPPLDDDSLLELYAYHRFDDFSSHASYITERRDVLKKMFTLVERHTLMITLLAKLPGRSFLNESKIYELLEDELNIPPEAVNIIKDGANIEDTIKEIIRKLFTITRLTDIEKSIMRYMSMVPIGGIEIELFAELTGHSKKEIFSLINSHWITLNEETLIIRLHPLICDTILSLNETKPSKEICNEFVTCISAKQKSLSTDSPIWHTLNKIKASSVSSFFSVIKNIPMSYEPSVKFFDLLREENQDPLLFFNKSLRNYSNSDLSKNNE